MTVSATKYEIKSNFGELLITIAILYFKFYILYILIFKIDSFYCKTN